MSIKLYGHRRTVAFLAVTFLVGFAAGARFWPSVQSRYAGFQRYLLVKELRPVSLTNCQFSRIGGAGDGGYLLCSNLADTAKSAYSYGIAGEDQWGCDIAGRFKLPVHQYDCFDLRRPRCNGSQGWSDFHEECVGPKKELHDKRAFDSVENQIAANQDQGKKLLFKMDVEGAEWESLAAMSDETLQNIEQLSMELHDVHEDTYSKYKLIKRLKKYFHIVNVHFNNYSCRPNVAPLPALTFQVLMVNKRLGQLDEITSPEAFRNPLDHPDAAGLPDCQMQW